MTAGFLFASAFLASAVEFVEALTIVLAAGITRGWRSALAGLAAATVVLAAIVAVLGPALTLIPIDVLRLIVGGLLLTFGLQWLRKAILRASGYKALHDEDAIFAREQEEARAAGREERAGTRLVRVHARFQGRAARRASKSRSSCITFGSTQGNIGLAALGAAVALVLVVIVGVFVRAPLARVPENTLKFAVGVDADDVRDLLVGRRRGRALARRRRIASGRARLRRAPLLRGRRDPPPPAARVRMRRIRAFGHFWWDFVVGDDWRAAAGVVLAIGATAVLVAAGINAWWLMPVAVAVVLWLSLLRAARADSKLFVAEPNVFGESSVAPGRVSGTRACQRVRLRPPRMSRRGAQLVGREQ